MRYKRLVYIDIFSIGSFHEVFNASSLKMFSRIYDEVVYCTTRSVAANTCKIIGEVLPNVRHRFIPIISLNNKIGFFLRLFVPIITSAYLLVLTKKDDLLFFNFNALWALQLINFLSRILNRRVVVMLHGELEYLVKPYPLNRISSAVLRKIGEGGFTPSKMFHFCVLGESIKRNMKGLVSDEIYEKTLSFEHSYIFRSDVIASNMNDEVIRVGVVGTLRDSEKYDALVRIAKHIKACERIQLHALGRIYIEKKDLDELGVRIVPESDSRFLTRSELDHAISRMDYSLFLMPTGSYKFTASGALYDAIDNEKPIISLKNDYFEHVFSQRATVGKLFETEEELRDYLIVVNSQSILIDFKAVKDALSPESVGLDFQTQLEGRAL